jgi:hypothetical protein
MKLLVLAKRTAGSGNPLWSSQCRNGRKEENQEKLHGDDDVLGGSKCESKVQFFHRLRANSALYLEVDQKRADCQLNLVTFRHSWLRLFFMWLPYIYDRNSNGHI